MKYLHMFLSRKNSKSNHHTLRSKLRIEFAAQVSSIPKGPIFYINVLPPYNLVSNFSLLTQALVTQIPKEKTLREVEGTVSSTHGKGNPPKKKTASLEHCPKVVPSPLSIWIPMWFLDNPEVNLCIYRYKNKNNNTSWYDEDMTWTIFYKKEKFKLYEYQRSFSCGNDDKPNNYEPPLEFNRLVTKSGFSFSLIIKKYIYILYYMFYFLNLWEYPLMSYICSSLSWLLLSCTLW